MEFKRELIRAARAAKSPTFYLKKIYIIKNLEILPP